MSTSTYRKLQDKHVLVIGASSGIGKAVAEAALASGAHVTISSRSQSRIESAVAELSAGYPNRKVSGRAADLCTDTTEAELEALFQFALSSSGAVNHVVFTAADSLSLGSLDTVDADLIRKAAHMRLVVPVLAAKVAAKHLPKSTESSLTITTGAVAERPDKGWAVTAYFAGGLQSLARALALDMAPVRVNAVRPGYVDTGLWGDSREAIGKLAEKLPLGKFAQVEDVAEAYLWLMKDRNATGSVAGTDSGTLIA